MTVKRAFTNRIVIAKIDSPVDEYCGGRADIVYCCSLSNPSFMNSRQAVQFSSGYTGYYLLFVAASASSPNFDHPAVVHLTRT